MTVIEDQYWDLQEETEDAERLYKRARAKLQSDEIDENVSPDNHHMLAERASTWHETATL